jgi:probable phosphoglycerate mutase
VRLLLIRHGESICGVDGIVGGARGCTGLTDRGLAQAEALRNRLVREEARIDVLFASTLPRAQQTAAVVAEGFGLDVIHDADLCEFMPGEIDGSPWETWDRFDVLAEPDRPMSPGGESLTVFRSRVRGLLDRLVDEHDGRVVAAVCHGGVVFGSLSEIFGLHDRRFGAQADFTSITEWRHGEDGWHLVRWNDVAHLLGSDLLPADD